MSGSKICVVDDDEGVRDSVAALLEAHGFETEVFATADDFRRRVDPAKCACILLDVRMPGTDGLVLLDVLAGAPEDIPVIMMTAHGDVPMAVRAMRSGAADFIEKPFEPERLLESIGQATTRPAPTGAPLEPALRERFAELTPRETEVMREMVVGHPNKVIAHRLRISPRTVEIHRGRVMQKTGAVSLSHLVRMAMRAGFDPGDR
jgi:two-component system, LuxR family, response regulator FixJ